MGEIIILIATKSRQNQGRLFVPYRLSLNR
jgi:hypothetical protein